MTTPGGYLRYPHVHGNLITFVADDDIWLAPADGGRAWRVTADHAPARHPRLGPDGAAIAWTSTRDGVAEVYLAGTDGTDARRLTYWGDDATRTCGWTPDGSILAVTSAGQPFRHAMIGCALPADEAAAAAPPVPLPVGPVADLAVDAASVALLTGSWGRDAAYWKRYRGGTAGRLWLGPADAVHRPAGATAGEGGAGGTIAGEGGADGAAAFIRVLAGLDGQLACPMLAGGRLAFLSDHEGTGNVYSCALDGSDLRRHTDHDGFYARNASTDGCRIVYHCAGEIWLLDSLGAAAPRRLELRLGGPASRAPRPVSADDHLGELSCDHTGQASAIEVRGTVHWLTHRDGPARALAVTPGVRARLPRVLGRSGQVIWVTDADGGDALEIAPASGAPGQPPRRIAGGQLGRVSGLAAAPDGAGVAVVSQDGRLRLVDVASATVTELAASAAGPVSGLAWSPDSAWLAWSEPVTEPLSMLRLARRDDPAAVVDVTDGRFADSDPVFTLDGQYLAFLSRRSFDPVYDAHAFDLSFPYGCRPYLVPLAAAAASPFAALPDGRPIPARAADGDAGGSGSDAAPGQPGSPGDESGPGQPAGVPAVTVDAEGLAGRIVQLPVAESRYSSLRAVKGGLAWLREPVVGSLGMSGARPDDEAPRPALVYFDFAQQRCTELADEADWFQPSGDGKLLVVSDHGELSVLPADRKADSDNPADRVQVDTSRARFLAEPAALWRNAYDEAARLIRHDFWVPDLAEVDWDEALGGYRPLLDQVATPADFADLMWEVLGELGTSHAYVAGAGASPWTGPDGAAIGRLQPGLLGADLRRGEDGRWQVARVLPGESSDPRARSPLAAPGAGVRPGDALLAVDGQPVTAAGPGPLLGGTAGKPVELTIGPAAGGAPRRIAVVPLADERRLRYQDWVAGRRRLVRELSDGRIGYLHVPDMVSEGWADFHRDLHAEMARDALVLDVRGNRGGHTSELIVEKLARRVVGWSVPRNLRPDTYPQDAPRGPVVALADENAGSDGDIVIAAIKILHLGPVVGTRTWGGVVGIDGYHELVDGTSITVPRYAIWLDGFGWQLENRGVEPDVEVVPAPEDAATGRDRQLETAVTLALEALAARPPAAPPGTQDRPAKRRPPLPPR
ncbi:MAG: S41 family peptidase [Streptosporangiaceae bacterium]